MKKQKVPRPALKPIEAIMSIPKKAKIAAAVTVAVVALLLVIANIPVPAAKPVNTPQQVQVTQPPFDYQKFAETLGGYRIEMGVHALSQDPVLDAAARLHAYDMKNKGYYSHTEPDGTTPQQRIYTAVGYSVYAGENQDNVCTNVDAGNEFARFTGSVEHNDNILDPGFYEFGVGYAPSDPGKCNGYIVFDYAGPVQ